jgi:hypothetical protein
VPRQLDQAAVGVGEALGEGPLVAADPGRPGLAAQGGASGRIELEEAAVTDQADALVEARPDEDQALGERVGGVGQGRDPLPGDAAVRGVDAAAAVVGDRALARASSGAISRRWTIAAR